MDANQETSQMARIEQKLDLLLGTLSPVVTDRGKRKPRISKSTIKNRMALAIVTKQIQKNQAKS